MYIEMNPAGVSTKQDATKARQEYINNLRLEVSNLQKTKNALDVLESTGQTPSRPTDMRTQLQKYADIEKIKVDLHEQLKAIMDGTNATQVLTDLGRNPKDLFFVANRMAMLIPEFQSKYKLGTPYLVFLSTIRRMMKEESKKEQEDLGFQYSAKADEEKGNPRAIPIYEYDEDKHDPSGMNFKRAQSKKGVDRGTERRADKKTEETRKKREKIVNKKREAIDERRRTAEEKQRKKEEKHKKTRAESTQKRADNKMEEGKKKRETIIEKKRNTRKRKAAGGDTDEDEPPKKRANLNIIEEIPHLEGSGFENEKKTYLVDYLRNNPVTHLSLPGIKQQYTASKIMALKSDKTGFNVDKLYKKYHRTGSGIETKPKPTNIIFGGGVKVHRQKVDIDSENAIVPKERYSQFGRYIINNHRLNDQVIMLRSPKGGNIAQLPTQKVSKNLIKAVSKMVNGGSLEYDDIDKLNEQEKDHLHSIVNKSHLGDKFKVPKPDECKIDKENHRFEVLKGEILAGNNSQTAIKEFKLLIVKLMNEQRLPRRQGTEILTDLTTLGF